MRVTIYPGFLNAWSYKVFRIFPVKYSEIWRDAQDFAMLAENTVDHTTTGREVMKLLLVKRGFLWVLLGKLEE